MKPLIVGCKGEISRFSLSGCTTERFQSKHKNISNIPKSWGSTDRRKFFTPRPGTQMVECSFPAETPCSVDMKFSTIYPGLKVMEDGMEYRELKAKEVVKVGDEWKMTSRPHDKWRPIAEDSLL